MVKNNVYIVSGNAITEFLRIDELNVFLHGANCQCTMRSGIAKEVVRTLPELYEADQQTRPQYHHPSDKLGQISHASYPGDKIAYNLYTQNYYGTDRRHLNYGALTRSLYLAHQHATHRLANLDEINVAMPRIGCGLGGGDWEVVNEILSYIYTPKFNYYVFDLV